MLPIIGSAVAEISRFAHFFVKVLNCKEPQLHSYLGLKIQMFLLSEIGCSTCVCSDYVCSGGISYADSKMALCLLSSFFFQEYKFCHLNPSWDGTIAKPPQQSHLHKCCKMYHNIVPMTTKQTLVFLYSPMRCVPTGPWMNRATIFTMRTFLKC